MHRILFIIVLNTWFQIKNENNDEAINEIYIPIILRIIENKYSSVFLLIRRVLQLQNKNKNIS